MDKNDLISVIVPVYRVEPYIEKCIDSIVNQTYERLEIILVDDGSPDTCGEICDRYAKEDSRIRVIHKENGGLSDARNVGMERASGEYIAFIDSDDWIEPNMIEVLYRACVDSGARMACCGRFDANEDYSKRKGICPNKDEVVSTEDMLNYMLSSNGTSCIACDKLYHKDLFLGVRFPKGKIYEDIPTVYKCVIRAEKIALCAIPLYNYYHRSTAITNMSFSPRLFDYTEHTKMVLEEMEKSYPSVLDSAKKMRVESIAFLLSKISLQKREIRKKYKAEYKELLRELRSLKSFWKRSGLIASRSRLLYTCLTFGIYRHVRRAKGAFCRK